MTAAILKIMTNKLLLRLKLNPESSVRLVVLVIFVLLFVWFVTFKASSESSLESEAL